jgi:hypothetical protein
MSTWTTEDREEAEKIMNNEPSHKAEPVAYAMFRDGEYYDAIHPDEQAKTVGEYNIPLYTHPAETITLAELRQTELYRKEQTRHLRELLEPKTLTDEEILTAIKSIADDVGSYKEYENTYEDGWLDACNTVYDAVFAILRKAQEK